MVVFSTGVMGAGKSFEAICRLYTYFGKDKKTKDYLKTKFTVNKDIKYFRTNIPYNKDSFEYDDNLDTSFKFAKFYEKIEMLHLFYLDDSIDEDTLKEKAVELGISNTFYLIDECQNYLDKANNVLIFFFTYHRHFNCEVVLITQNLSLVNYKYKGFCEQFIRAVPSTFNLFSTSFTYKYFPTSRMAAKELFKTVKIKKLNLIYEAYTSGGKVFTNNVIKKILFTSLTFLFLLIVFTYYILNYYFAPIQSEQQIIEQSQIKTQPIQQLNNNEPNPINPIQNEIPIIQESENLKLFKFNCFNKFCYYKIDNRNTLEIPLNFITTYIKDIEEDKKFFYMEKNRLVLYLLVDEKKFNFINKGVQNENDKQTGFNGIGLGGLPN